MNLRIAGLALLIGTLSIFAQSTAQGPPAINGGHRVMMLEPLFAPRTLLQMVRATDLIVDGSVSASLGAIGTSTDPNRPMFETHSIVAVNEVVWVQFRTRPQTSSWRR